VVTQKLKTLPKFRNINAPGGERPLGDIYEIFRVLWSFVIDYVLKFGPIRSSRASKLWGFPVRVLKNCSIFRRMEYRGSRDLPASPTQQNMR